MKLLQIHQIHCWNKNETQKKGTHRDKNSKEQERVKTRTKDNILVHKFSSYVHILIWDLPIIHEILLNIQSSSNYGHANHLWLFLPSLCLFSNCCIKSKRLLDAATWYLAAMAGSHELLWPCWSSLVFKKRLYLWHPWAPIEIILDTITIFTRPAIVYHDIFFNFIF